jgi:hypothetical protein
MSNMVHKILLNHVNFERDSLGATYAKADLSRLAQPATMKKRSIKTAELVN